MAETETSPREAPRELATRGVFEERAGSPLLDFSTSLGLGPQPRDFEAERAPLRKRQEETFDARRQTLQAAQTETTRQADDAEREATEQAGERARAKPAPLALSPSPTGEPRPFLTPGPSVLSGIQTLLLGAGQMGMQIQGLRGSAVAAVSAMKGMAEGWAAGDAERVKREHAAWKDASERLIALHEDALRAYRELIEDQKLTSSAKRAIGTVRLKGYEWQSAQQALDSGDIAAQLKELDTAQQRHDSLVEKAREFDEGMTEKRRYHDIYADIQGENRKERAREADQRHALALQKFRQSASQTGPTFTPEALEMHAHVVANGGPQPALGWGKAATDARITISNRAAEIRKARGDEPGSLLLAQQSQQANLAELKKIQTQRGPMLAFAATAEKNLDIAVRLSETVDREQYPAFNRWLLSGELKWSGDPGVAAFAAATRTAINETAKVTNSATGGGVSTDSSRREIEEMLSTSMNPEQFRAVAGVLRQDMRNRIHGYDEQISATKAAIAGGGAAPTPATQTIKRKSDGKLFEGAKGAAVPDGYELVTGGGSPAAPLVR